jgi:membrane protein implicated in regulation of membrane protease activity
MHAKEKFKPVIDKGGEELSVQVMLSIYSTDIQTQVATIFGTAAFIVGVGAIVFTNLTITAVVFWGIMSTICMYVLFSARDRYTQRRQQLDQLRKKYCPEAYKWPIDET